MALTSESVANVRCMWPQGLYRCSAVLFVIFSVVGYFDKIWVHAKRVLIYRNVILPLHFYTSVAKGVYSCDALGEVLFSETNIRFYCLKIPIATPIVRVP